MDWRLVVAVVAVCVASAVLARTEYLLWRDGRVWPYRRQQQERWWL